ncbi:glycosyltransferase family 1 protein [Isoptericola sp. NPDC019482]|uniref:glycosyltransferase family 4 protein n=1 Tax=Isoptericola sp. NPDC019482 TaxID=3154688 RepID=UPI003483ED1A
MHPRLVIATLASAHPMGQQAYEERVATLAPAAVGGGVEVRRAVVRTLRSPLPGTARVPGRLLRRSSAGVRRAAGAVLYGRAQAVHRMGLSLPPASVPEIVTIHDTVAWRFPDETPPEPFAAEETRRAAAVVAVSRFSADDAAERLGLDHVHVVHNGVGTEFFDPEPLDAGTLAALGVPGRFVLHAGGSTLRKNLEGLAAAWPRVRAAHPDVRLILTGPPSDRRDRLFGPVDGALRVGRLPDAVLPRLMASASAVVVPSLYEGFGLPALEAMAARVPVVAADRSSLPEVCGEAGWLVEPDSRSLADGLVHVLDGGGDVDARVRAGRDRAAQFTWERSAAGHARVWREVLGLDLGPLVSAGPQQEGGGTTP